MDVSSPHVSSPHASSPHASSPHVSSPHVSSPHAISPHASSPLCCSSFVQQNSECDAVGFKPTSLENGWYIARTVGGES